jgi:autonomous glycyl radical cofactor GrcA
MAVTIPAHCTETEVTMGTKREDYCYGQSAYMRAEEWVGKSVPLYIEEVEDVEFEKGLKPVLKFRGQEKGLVVNATNYDILADAFGNNPTKWPGHTIVLKGEKVRFKGRPVDSIRIVPKRSKSKPAPTEPDDLEDEIPDDFAA